MGRRNPFLEDIRAIVLNNYTDEQFGVSELVKIYGKSRSQLHRKVKSATGKSLSQFIREIRLDEAMKMLIEEEITASEVAYQVGFNSPTYFNTCFNEYFGYPPGEAKQRTEFEEQAGASPIEVPKRQGKNTRILVWLVIVMVIVISAVAFNYLSQAGNVASEEIAEKPKTIAVLPFKNWSGDPELEYVSDGMTDAVITRLSHIKGIDGVIPFSTSVNYKNSDKNIEEIARELGVEYILEGNFKLSGERIQSNLNLIEVRTNRFLWSLEYKGYWKADEIFEMQAAIAENVAKNMQVHVTKAEIEELNLMLTESEEAYRLYLQGIDQYNKLSHYGLENAISLFKQAIVLDSTFIDAHIDLGNTYMLSGFFWGMMPEQEAWGYSKQYLEKALQLDKEKGGHYEDIVNFKMAAGLFYYDLDIRKVEKMFVESMSLPDSEERTFDFDYARKTGRFETTMKLLDNFIEKDPAFFEGYMQKAVTHFLMGENDKAKRILSEHDPLLQDNYFYLIETSKWYYYMDEMEKSENHLNAILEQFEDRPAILHWLSAVHAEMNEDSAAVDANLKILNQKYDEMESGSPAWFIALYYCHIQEYDSAFEWLNKSFERREVELTWFKEEPLLQPLKADPRYIELYNKIGFNVIAPLVE